MADEFKGNVEAMKLAGDYLKSMNTEASRTSVELQNMTVVMRELSKAKGELAGSNMAIVDPNLVKVLDEVDKRLVQLGASKEHMAKMAAEEALATKGQLLTTDQLTKREERFVNMQLKALNTKKMYVQTEKGLIALTNREQINQNKFAQGVKKHMADQAKGAAFFAKNLVASNLTLAGIIAMLLEAYNTLNRIAGMSKQAAAHWGDMASGAARANVTMHSLRGTFKKTFDESGKIVGALAKTGYSSKSIATTNESINDKVGKRLTAERALGVFADNSLLKNEKLHKIIERQLATKKTEYGLAMLFQARETKFGIDIGTQSGYVKDLANNFGLSAKGADNMMGTVIRSTVAMRKAAEKGEDIGNGLSIEDVLQDWSEMSTKAKVYNTDLLGTLAVYNTLINKNVADKLGFGKAPANVRRNIAKTFAGMSAELGDQWKAALGSMTGGKSPLKGLFDFEAMGLPEQIKAVSDFISQNVSGSIEEQMYAARQLLEKMGFGADERKVLAEAMVQGGALRGDKLDSAIKAIQGQRDAEQKRLEDEKAGQKSLVKSAGGIASNLQSVEDMIRQWVENVFMKWMDEISSLLRVIAKVPADIRMVASAKTYEEIGGYIFNKKPKQTAAEGASGVASTLGTLDTGATTGYLSALQSRGIQPAEVAKAITLMKNQGFSKEVEAIARSISQKNVAQAMENTKKSLRSALDIMESSGAQEGDPANYQFLTRVSTRID